MKRIRKAKLFVFLRQHRHELLNEAFVAVTNLLPLYWDTREDTHMVGQQVGTFLTMEPS